MSKKLFPLIIMIFILNMGFSVADQEKVYWDLVAKIREEGFDNSHIMEDVSYLTDVFGPRLAKSPSYLAAAQCVKKKFKEYGLTLVELLNYMESARFGREK
jgi:hypothetical protein